MAMPTTKAECEKLGFNWNDDTQTCTMPKVSLVKLTISRGAGCDGRSEAVLIKRKLPLDAKLALIKAARKRKR